MKMLELNDDFYIEIGIHTENRWRTIKDEYRRKNLEEYEANTFYPIAIWTQKNNLVCNNAKDINKFLELLGAFVSNQLNAEKEYKVTYEDGGFIGRIVKRKNTICLAIKVNNEENFILEKYDCRVIVANAKQILSKCTLKDFIRA